MTGRIVPENSEDEIAPEASIAQEAAAAKIVNGIRLGLEKAKKKKAVLQIATLNFWRKSTFDKPPPLWKKLATVDSGLYCSPFPHVGGSISVQTDDQGFSFVLDVRLRTRTVALLNVDEHDNTFEAILEVFLEFEILASQYDVCTEFWEKFRPHLAFQNSVDSTEAPEPIFDQSSEPSENGCLMLRDERDGKRTIMRHFEYYRRTQRKFRQPLDLVYFPFDVQTLPIIFYASRTFMYGRPYHLRLRHPQARDDFNCNNIIDGAHVFEKNADCVDDMQTETIYALEGTEMLPELTEVPKPGTPEARVRPRHDEYAVMIFVSRQYKSTIYNVHVPLFFMYVLSFLAYFIPPCAVVDRASVSLTLLLTTVALKTYMSDKLPSVPYMSAAENFLLYITVCLLLQSLMMAAAASSCVRFGAAGQFGFDLDVLKKIEYGEYDINDDDAVSALTSDWDCRTEENNFDFWCANRRARIQSLLDIISVWTSITIGFYTVCKHIFANILRMYKRLYDIHRHKFLSETSELYKHADIRQKHRNESMLCFFAIRHAEDADAWSGFRFLFRSAEPLCWRLHLMRIWALTKFCKQKEKSQQSTISRLLHETTTSEDNKNDEEAKDGTSDSVTSTTNDEAPAKDCCSGSDTGIEEKTKDFFAKQKVSKEFFAKLSTQRAMGYDNLQYYHGFRRPAWEKPIKSPQLRREIPSTNRQADSAKSDARPPGHLLASVTNNKIETKKVILFDCGTGETKSLIASLVIDKSAKQHSQMVVIRDKENTDYGSFHDEDDRKVEMPDYCLRGDTQSFIHWVESHVYPAFDIRIPHDRNITEDDIDVSEIFGFKTVQLLDPTLKRPLYKIDRVMDKDSLPSTLQDIRTSDGIRLLPPREGMAIITVNGAPYDETAAKKCIIRAAHLSKNFRNPKLHDRVEALTALYFRQLRPKTDRDCYLGDAVAVSEFESTSESACGVILPGQKGTIVREGRSPPSSCNGESTTIMFFVVWDHEPALGVTMINQRHYLKDAGIETILSDARIKPIPEVHLDCLCHAEADAYEWSEPVVVIGTGAWFRNSRGKLRANATDMFREIERRHPNWKLERNTEFDEAWFEDLSVRYIHQYYKLYPPDAVLAVGNGSTQYSSIIAPDIRDRVIAKKRTKDQKLVRAVVKARVWQPRSLMYHYIVLLEPKDTYEDAEHCPPRQLLATEQKNVRDGTNDELKNLQRSAKANELVTISPSSDPCDDEPVPTECKVPYLIQNGNRRGKSFFESRLYTRGKVGNQLRERCKQWSIHAKELLRDLIRQNRICKGVPSYVCCISACYYAADFADCKTHEPITAAEARLKYETALNDLIRRADTAANSSRLSPDYEGRIKLADILNQVILNYKSEGINMYQDKDKFKKQMRGLKTGATVLSNLTYQIALIDMFFDDNTTLRICRNWNIGEYEFRTSWTSGYYLNWLRSQHGVTIPI